MSNHPLRPNEGCIAPGESNAVSKVQAQYVHRSECLASPAWARMQVSQACLKVTGLPSSCSGVRSNSWTAAKSAASEKPRDCRLQNSFMDLGAWSPVPDDLISNEFNLTAACNTGVSTKHFSFPMDETQDEPNAICLLQHEPPLNAMPKQKLVQFLMHVQMNQCDGAHQLAVNDCLPYAVISEDFEARTVHRSNEAHLAEK